MLIKITESCHAGCIHCMNNATPCNRHMTMNTFLESLEFANKYDARINGKRLGDIITGGEPTEHPQFIEFIHKYYEVCPDNLSLVVTTNGHYLLDHYDDIHKLLEQYPNLLFQVTYDNRYYPKKLDITKRVLRHKRIMICTEVQRIYPQGRAKSNNLPYKTNAPHCFNIQLIALQLYMRNEYSLHNLLQEMRRVGYNCCPAIRYDGSIGLGESDLCPSSININDSESTILNYIANFECDGCPEAMSQLSIDSLKLKDQLF